MAIQPPEQMQTITLKVNGVVQTITIPVRKTLLDMVREDLMLTGSHAGQQFPETHKSQYSPGIPTCLFVNGHAKMGLS